LNQLLPDLTVLSSQRAIKSPAHKIHTLSQLFNKAPTDEEVSSTLQKLLDESQMDNGSIVFQDKRG
jgi:hypothetical protein